MTAAGHTYHLPEPFFVLATQNPIEQEGTYPLPEAQLDRFMFNLWVDYPSFQEEVEIVKRTTAGAQSLPQAVMGAEQLLAAQELVRRVPVPDNVVEYAVRLVTTTRVRQNGAPQFVKDFLSYGAGPRASQYLILGAKTRAVLHGRFSPEIDDVRAVAVALRCWDRLGRWILGLRWHRLERLALRGRAPLAVEAALGHGDGRASDI